MFTVYIKSNDFGTLLMNLTSFTQRSLVNIFTLVY